MVTGALGPVTVAAGVPGAKITVPPATPGPVPPLPALSTRPIGRPRLWGGILLPRVSVILAPMLTSSAAQMDMFPSVVVMAAPMLTLRPAARETLPLTVVMAAFTFTSRPQHATRFPLVALIGWFTFTSRDAFSVSVEGLELAVQLTGWLI